MNNKNIIALNTIDCKNLTKINKNHTDKSIYFEIHVEFNIKPEKIWIENYAFISKLADPK